MADHYDDRLPDPIPQPRPHGWFEVFCCGSMVFAFVAVIFVISLIH
jgi:hypothetical protein